MYKGCIKTPGSLNHDKKGDETMDEHRIAPHESIELHEILTFKNVCLTKAVTMSALVSDNELKSIMQQDITTTERQIRELRGLLENAFTGAGTDTGTSTLS